MLALFGGNIEFLYDERMCVRVLTLLVFQVPLLFTIFTITFPLAISIVDKLPKAISLNIGKLNADDIRKLDYHKRSYLRNQVFLYFIKAVLVTCLIGLLFCVLTSIDNVLFITLCSLIQVIVGLTIAFRVFKKTNVLKETL